MVSEGQKRILLNAGLHALVGFLGSTVAIVGLVGQPNWEESAYIALVTAILGAAAIFVNDLQTQNFATASKGDKPKTKLGL